MTIHKEKKKTSQKEWQQIVRKGIARTCQIHAFDELLTFPCGKKQKCRNDTNR